MELYVCSMKSRIAFLSLIPPDDPECSDAPYALAPSIAETYSRHLDHTRFVLSHTYITCLPSSLSVSPPSVLSPRKQSHHYDNFTTTQPSGSLIPSKCKAHHLASNPRIQRRAHGPSFFKGTIAGRTSGKLLEWNNHSMDCRKRDVRIIQSFIAR